MVFSKKWLRNHQKFLLYFLIHIDVLMLCSKFELIPTSIFRVMTILRIRQKFEKYLRLQSMVFSKKWLRNHQKFLLHFLIHIDVVMLCSKFESIPTSIFRVMTILRKRQIFENYLRLQSMVFSKKWLRNHQKFLLHFLIHIDVLMLCSKFELIPTSIFRVTVIFKNEPKSEKIPVLQPMDFCKKWLRNHQNFYYIFLYILMYLCCVASLS